MFSDPPGPAFLEKDLDTVVKGDSLTLTCGLTDLGRPAVNRYIWKLDDKEVAQVTTYNWTINPVQLEHQANISCTPENFIGRGKSDSIDVQVLGEFRISTTTYATSNSVCFD